MNESTKSLPRLIGSEKQVAWANEIRDRIFPKIEADGLAAKKILDIARANLANEKRMAAVMAKHNLSREKVIELFNKQAQPSQSLVDYYNAARTNASAAWWIEHR